MSKQQARVLFLGKDKDAHVERAVRFCRMNFTEVSVHLGNWGDPLPDEARTWRGDYIVSYLSRWIVPQGLLDEASIALNFHPGPPDYPGYGCNNFAIYEDASAYGVTCHRMALQVDTGTIVGVKRFPVFASDDAATLLSRAYDYQLVLFYEVVGRVMQGEALPATEEKWTRKPFTRREFNQLLRITADMSQAEIARRIRASTLGVTKPTVELNGFVFELKLSQDN